MHIYFVRHGETQLNKDHVYYGSLDVSLTETGVHQGERIRSYLHHVSFQRVYVSNKKRAMETAKLVAADVPEKDICVVPAFAELNFGCFEGLTNRQVQEKFPEIYKAWCNDWIHYIIPQGECFNDFFMRVKGAFECLLKDWAGLEQESNILVCAHNGTLRVLFALMCGLAAEGTWHFNFDQDAYSKVDYEWGNFTIRTINNRNME